MGFMLAQAIYFPAAFVEKSMVRCMVELHALKIIAGHITISHNNGQPSVLLHQAELILKQGLLLG